MRYHLLATDYDGTLTINDKVQLEIIEALIRLKAGGRKLILVTGRRLDELKSIFPEHHIFDRIVAENGALIYTPESMEINLSGEPPPGTFFQLLKKKNIPYVVGKVIVASTEPHQVEILDAIVKSGIEYQVIFNKGAVMVLPPGINKATGLREALSSLCISTHNTVAIGDAENDYAMLQTVEMFMGESPEIAMAGYAETISKQIELPQNLIFEQGDVLVWKTDKNKPFLIRSDIPGQFLRRHKRKYAKGDMGDNSFYFTGPMHRLNLKANNLMIFIQMGSGVDDETWLFHLCKHDYSNWFRNSIKDEQLAINTENIESRIQNPEDSREAIFNFIVERYTAPG